MKEVVWTENPGVQLSVELAGPLVEVCFLEAVTGKVLASCQVASYRWDRINKAIHIGPYLIRTWDGIGGDFFIEHESGEGMGVSAASLIALIGKFYKDNF